MSDVGNVRQPSASSTGRLNDLDALRGLAAGQVLILHILSALAPGFVLSTPASGTVAGWVHASPLFITYDGYSAVYLFFLLSGYVLTSAFKKQAATPVRVILGRIVRLGVPALAACLLSALLLAIFGNTNIEAGRITGSTWYAALWMAEPGFLPAVKEALLNGLFLGFRPVEPFMDLWPDLRPTLDKAFVSPLWTLSVEFWGSCLVLGLVIVRGRLPRFTPLIWLFAMVLLFRGPYLCFLCGHILATVRAAERPPMLGSRIPIALVVLGLAICCVAEFTAPNLLKHVCDLNLPATPCSPLNLQVKILGCILVFVGVIQSGLLRSWLARPILQPLAAISFSLYLTHWPLLFGPVALVLVKVSAVAGLEAGRIAAMMSALALSVAVAYAFLPVDRLAIRLSRRIRG